MRAISPIPTTQPSPTVQRPEQSPDFSPTEPAPIVSHCLLLETDHGLVLVDTGFGTVNATDPTGTLGQDFLDWAQPILDPTETAYHQIAELGYQPDDVRHIVLTHLHRDHSGGISDFPHARVHVHRRELDASTSESYPQRHWAHGPDWSPYEDGGESWNGFENVRALEGLSNQLLLVPLAGHTPGHVGVAVDTGQGWLLHVGDAYYYHGELIDPPVAPPELDSLQAAVEIDRAQRQHNRDRLRELAEVGHADGGVTICSAHDPWEFDRLAGSVTARDATTEDS